MKTRPALMLALAALALAGFACAAMQSYFSPKFENSGAHENAVKMTEEQCFSCHLEGKDGAPVAPKSMIGRTNCQYCHLSD